MQCEVAAADREQSLLDDSEHVGAVTFLSQSESTATLPETYVLHCQVMRNAGEGFRVASLAGPLGSLFRSIALGAAAGALIGRVISLPARPFNWALRRLPQAAGGRVKARALKFSDLDRMPVAAQSISIYAPHIPLLPHASTVAGLRTSEACIALLLVLHAVQMREQSLDQLHVASARQSRGQWQWWAWQWPCSGRPSALRQSRCSPACWRAS